MINNSRQTEIQKDVFEMAINFDDLTIDKKEIELTLGYTENKIPKHFSELIDDILKELPKRCNIKAGYRILGIKKPADKIDGLIIADKFFKMDKIVTGQIKKSEKAALFVCMIGPEMEKWSKQLLINGDPAMSYLVDCVASITVENVTDYLHDHIEREMTKSGLKITNRYSPGYCNWSVSEQHLLFSLLPEKFCGITLTESALMLPIKSVSGVIGIGSNVKRKEYKCDSCGVKDCTYRANRSMRVDKKNVKEKLSSS
jgi:hypothetical protein